tara:strand:- start:1343 stop:1969 length:627 start_codon:yes stop_codon:yes gene_type:complete
MSSKLGVILAGGQSKRMNGVNKAYLTLDGETFLERAIKRAAPQVNKLIVSTNTRITDNVNINIEVISDPDGSFGGGPLAGILAAFNWAYKNFPDVEHIASFGVDVPFFPRNLIQKFDDRIKKEKLNINSCYACSDSVLHPIFSVSSFSLYDDLRAYINNGNRKVDKWMNKNRFLIEDFGNHSPDAFFNVNTPEDLECARKISKDNPDF